MTKIRNWKKYAGVFFVAITFLLTTVATVPVTAGVNGPYPGDYDITITIGRRDYSLLELIDMQEDWPWIVHNILAALYEITDRRSFAFAVEDYSWLPDRQGDDYGTRFYTPKFFDTDSSHTVDIYGTYTYQYPGEEPETHPLPKGTIQIPWTEWWRNKVSFEYVEHHAEIGGTEENPIYASWVHYDLKYYEDDVFIRHIDRTFTFNKNEGGEAEEGIYSHADVGGYNGFYFARPNHTVAFDGSKSIILDENIVNYTWGFGDENIGYGEQVDHIYNATGRYKIDLTITGNNGSMYFDAGTAVIADSIDDIIDSPDIGDTCFLAGTNVTMDNGSYKYIEEIEAGETVKAYDTLNEELLSATVTEIQQHTPEEMGDYYMKINDNICVTPNHPLSVFNEWIYAGHVQPFDVIYGIPGSCLIVTSVEKVYEQAPTYHLKLRPVPEEIDGGGRLHAIEITMGDQNLAYVVGGGAALAHSEKILPSTISAQTSQASAASTQGEEIDIGGR